MQINKYERRKVISWLDGAVFRTAGVGYQWFEVGKGPEVYVVDNQDLMWVTTDEYKIVPNLDEIGGYHEYAD